MRQNSIRIYMTSISRVHQKSVVIHIAINRYNLWGMQQECLEIDREQHHKCIILESYTIHVELVGKPFGIHMECIGIHMESMGNPLESVLHLSGIKCNLYGNLWGKSIRKIPRENPQGKSLSNMSNAKSKGKSLKKSLGKTSKGNP